MCMSKKELLTLACLGIAVGVLLPTEIFANKTTAYGAQEVARIGKDLKDFMFEILIPYAGGIFGGYQTIKSFMTNNYQSMGVFALLTATSFIMPPFLNGAFGAGMLLP